MIRVKNAVIVMWLEWGQKWEVVRRNEVVFEE
jgi:hypothetical protein